MRQKEENTGLKSFRLWTKDNGKKLFYKVFMTVPMLIFDICRIVWEFVKVFFMISIVYGITSIFDLMKKIYINVRDLWNSHNNNEWMYILGQIAGLCSYIIVFMYIQYGEYEEATKNVYEFIGNLIWIPYFVGKIAKVNKEKSI